MRHWLLLALVVPSGCVGFSGEAAPVTPQRPTVSSDTATTKAGTFEIETGVTIDPGDLLDTPSTLKWGADANTELFLGWSPYQFASRPGPDASGIGDTVFGIRNRLWEETESAPSAAIQFVTKLPSGDRSQGLSTGELDFHAAGILTRSFGEVSATAFYQAGILGNPNTGSTNTAHTFAIAAGMPVQDGVGVFGELSATWVPTLRQDVYLGMVGGTYAVTPSLVIDVAFAVGLSEDAPDFQVLVGLTTNLGRPRFFESLGN